MCKLITKEWLETRYWGQGRSAQEMADEVRVTRPTIYRWMREHEVRLRTKAERAARQSLRVAGEGNPAYIDGHSIKYQRRRAIGLHGNRCQWCATEKHIQVHHKDHNRANTGADNLMVLCRNCKILEVQAWILVQSGRATAFDFKDGRFAVHFTKE